jgi:hypothetical protein
LAQALFPAAAYLLCSGLNLGIATSLFQFARRRSEVRVLHEALTALGCWYLILAFAEMAPAVAWMAIAFFKAIAGTWLISSGVRLLAEKLRRFSGDSLQYRTVVISCHAVVIAVITVNMTAVDEPQSFAAAMRVVRVGYWLFTALFLFLGLRVIRTLHRRLPADKRSRLGRSIFGPLIEAPAVTPHEWWAYLTLITGSALSFFVYRALTKGSAGFYASLLPLFALSSFVYLQFRAVFVDVIVRRGTTLVVMLACGWFYFNYLGRRDGMATVFGLLFVCFWVAFNGPIARFLDRQLFGRPDHISLSQRMSLDMVGFVDRNKLIRHVASSLQIALAADWVKFIEPGKAGDDVRDVRMEVAVQSSDRNWGRLAFGPRRFGQTYKRDDLRFLRTVANQLAAVLQNFSLHDERQAQTQREHELRELATRAELQELRAQINPHFLFNTLSSIADMARHHPQKAETAILHLARIFRYALNSTRRETVPLGEEIDFLTAYLELEHERFGGRLNYRIDVDAEIRKLPIPPMLLQPVIENAVKHGIQMKVDGGIVSVSAEVRDQTLCLRVVDDGVGFNQVENHQHHRVAQEYRGGMGLANVRDRIARLSGAENFRISSTIGAGTTVEILLQMA